MRRLPLFTELGLLALLAWLLAGWLLPSDEGSSPVSPLPDNSEPTSESFPALNALIAVPLFGKAPPQPAVPQPKQVQKSQTLLKPLQITLLGTVVAGERSAAVISLDGKLAQEMIFLGEQIQPGVTLFHVDADAIVVEQSGRRQLVSLQREIVQGMMISEDKQTAPSKRMTDAGKVPTAQPQGKGAASSQSDKQAPHTRPRMTGLARLLTQAIFTPHLSDGKPDGLQISHIVIGSPFQKGGLYNGDVIRTVNGQLFTQAKQSLDLFKIMQYPGPIDFEIMRAGKVQDIHFRLKGTLPFKL